MTKTSVCMLAALLAVGAGEAVAQSRCYIWRDGRRVECDDGRHERERDRERRREEERRRERERRSRAESMVDRLFQIRREGPSFGVRGGYDFEEDGGTAGAQLRIPVAPALLFVPSADVFFDSDTEWQVNADAVIRPAALGGVYGGLGAAFVNRDPGELDDGETEVGLNLIVGLESARIRNTTVRPFVEGRWTTAEDYDAFRLAAGFNVPISGRR